MPYVIKDLSGSMHSPSSDVMSEAEDELLKIAASGNDDEWVTLHERCLDFGFAQMFAKVLASAPPSRKESARHWLAVICEFHPSLSADSSATESTRLIPTTERLRPEGPSQESSARCPSLRALVARFFLPHRG